MVKKSKIINVLIILLFSCFLAFISLGTENNSFLKELNDSHNFIVTRGTMPVITENEGKDEWRDSLVKCNRNNARLYQYLSSSDAPVIGVGVHTNGYVYVELERQKPEKVNGSVINEIYALIEEQCEQEGIIDVPVVFVFADMPIVEDPQVEPVDEVATSGMSDEENEGNKTAKQTPGFTSIMLTLSLLFAVKIKRQ
ncbi:hypothetical protein [Methanomethylovorans sp.]|uniref:hypothetical protein n=1 Tax=Methanomethylovorans sp. TaxID=2758717 RepID=UPI00351C6A98